MMKAPLVPFTKKPLGHVVPAKAAPAVKVKQHVILDLGDGAWNDDSVKVMVHDKDPSIAVVKCTDAKRLLRAFKALGVPLLKPLFKGRKHWIAMVPRATLNAAMLGGGAVGSTLPASHHTAHAVPHHQKAPALVGVKGSK